MTDALPAQAVVAIATVVAALITGVIAIVNLTLSKEQKVSELRQAWIDGLRDDIAKFLSGIRAKAVILQDTREGFTAGNKDDTTPTEEKVAERTAIAQEALYRIKLRLNPAEVDHQELERLLERLLATYDQLRRGANAEVVPAIVASIDLVTAHARTILKKEWERVKRGEQAFVTLKKLLVPSIVLITAAFAVALLWGNFR